MSEQPKPTDAEDILSEFNKDVQPKEKPISEQPNESIIEDTQTTTTPTVEEKEPEIESKEKIESKEDESDKPRDIIFVGKKPLMTYVNATLTQLSVAPVVTIKSRG